MIGGVVVWLVCPLDRPIPLTPGSSPGQALTLSHGGERGLLLSAEGAALVGVFELWSARMGGFVGSGGGNCVRGCGVCVGSGESLMPVRPGIPCESRFALSRPLTLREGDGRLALCEGDGRLALCEGDGCLCPSDISPVNGGERTARPPRASPAKVASLFRVPLRCAKVTGALRCVKVTGVFCCVKGTGALRRVKGTGFDAI